MYEKKSCAPLNDKLITLFLQVQNIRDEFTVSVYEAFAQIALEVRDYKEFSICIRQLSNLYIYLRTSPNVEQFTAYIMLDHAFTSTAHGEFLWIPKPITDVAIIII